MTIFAIFSDKHMPIYSDFWAAFSTLDKAIEVLIHIPKNIITEHRLEIYEVPVDGGDGDRKKRINANDPRIEEVTKQVANRRRHSP